MLNTPLSLKKSIVINKISVDIEDIVTTKHQVWLYNFLELQNDDSSNNKKKLILQNNRLNEIINYYFADLDNKDIFLGNKNIYLKEKKGSITENIDNIKLKSALQEYEKQIIGKHDKDTSSNISEEDLNYCILEVREYVEKYFSLKRGDRIKAKEYLQVIKMKAEKMY